MSTTYKIYDDTHINFLSADVLSKRAAMMITTFHGELRSG